MHGLIKYIISVLSISAIIVAQAAPKKKVADTTPPAVLAEACLKAYDLDGASEQLDRWEDMIEKDNKEYPAELSRLRDRVLMARNMLERVEKIQIVDTLTVDSVEFFKHYRLSADAGELCDTSILPDEYMSGPKVVYVPQSGKELFWGMPAARGTNLIVADILDDGTINEAQAFGKEINSGGDSDFPYLLQDGYTIYYANNGDDSLGGYDIFMTRRSADGTLLQSQNIGMPYNSPYNDFMMAIDETANLGWWASDRNQIPGKVTIYVFVPSTMRENYNPDLENIRSLALLDGVPVTGDLDNRLSNEVVDEDDSADVGEFYFPLSDGRVYTRLDDFKNPQARQAMKGLLKRMFDLEVLQAQLDGLRIEYEQGNKRIAGDILKLERNIKDAPDAIERVTNQIITLEEGKSQK